MRNNLVLETKKRVRILRQRHHLSMEKATIMIQKLNLLSSLAHLYPGTTISTKIDFLGESDTQGSLLADYSNFPVFYLAAGKPV